MKRAVFFLLIILFTTSGFAKNIKSTAVEKPKVTVPPIDLNLNPYYKKYIDANGIPIISSWRVPDSAMVKAWEIITFMTNDLPEANLKQMQKIGTKVAIMARYEGTTDIPEHAHLAKDTSINWDLRARGLGGDMQLPLTSGAEENILGYQIDKYHAEDILIHEFAHSIHLIGIAPIDKTFDPTLQKYLDMAVAEGKYDRTYAKTDIMEYWAEGVQNWFNTNAEVPKPDGKHNRLNTRKELKKYDPRLYDLIHKYFSEFDGNPSKHSVENKYKIK